MEWVIVALIIALLTWRIAPARGVKNISTKELKNILNDKDKVFVDVRTSAEYKGRHIREFKNIPLGSKWNQLPMDKEIVVICQSGMRSANACKQLKKLGYKHVTNVRGGMSAWN